jgi:hypothetical protein
MNLASPVKNGNNRTNSVLINAASQLTAVHAAPSKGNEYSSFLRLLLRRINTIMGGMP